MPLTLVSHLVDLVLPRDCVGCGRPTVSLCGACVSGCGPGGVLALASEPQPISVAAAGEYGGVVRRVVLAYKERGRRDLAGPLAALLARAVGLLVGAGPARPRLLLVAVPSSRSAAAARGGDHVARLARRAAVISGVRVVPDVLRLSRAVRDSAGLGVAERERNLHGALRARPPDRTLCRARLVIVDDVVTTGATIREAHRALVTAGWNVTGGAVVAATPKRDGPSIGNAQLTGLT